MIARQLGGDQVGILQVGYTNCQIDALILQINNALRKMQRDVQVRVCFNKRRQVRRNVFSAKGGRRGDNQAPGSTARAGRKCFLGSAQFVEDIAHVLEKGHTFWGKCNFSRGAFE